MSPHTPPTATLTDVSHIYGDTAVLRHITLQLEPARCSLLLGPNGAGKSTLLRILAGLLQPSFGAVSTWGLPPDQARERIAYMSHAPMLYEELSAIENLRYFAALYAPHPCLSPEQALGSVALNASLKRPVSAYSQGMRQRLSLARALLSRPALLLLDEPFSNMDTDSAHAMLTLLAQERDTGTTIVLTTHQRTLAEPIADELLLLAHGELLRETARAIPRNPMSNR